MLHIATLYSVLILMLQRTNLLLGGLCLLAFATTTVTAQSAAGLTAINGTITDPTGAIVAGAKVVAKETATGTTREASSTGSGLYSLPNLPVGDYEISVQQTGFKTAVRSDVEPTVGSVLTINIQLEVGGSTETVSVTSDAPVVETSRSQASTAVTQLQIQELPVNGRNFLDFTLTSPGVVRDPTRGGDISFGGQRGTSNSLLVDGSDSNNTFYGQSTGRAGTGRSPYSFSEDAIQEFQVNTNNYAAEIGRAGGGVINVITKSGTNAFHGDVFEFYRDKALNANSWDNNALGRAKRAYHFNQFGGIVGGPIAEEQVVLLLRLRWPAQHHPQHRRPGVFSLPRAMPSASAHLPSLAPYLASYANCLNNNVYLGKVDWNLTDNQHVSFPLQCQPLHRPELRKCRSHQRPGPHRQQQRHHRQCRRHLHQRAWLQTKCSRRPLLLHSRLRTRRSQLHHARNHHSAERATAISLRPQQFQPALHQHQHLSTHRNLRPHEGGSHTMKFGADIILQQIANFFPGTSAALTHSPASPTTPLTSPPASPRPLPDPNTTGATVYPNVNEYAFFAEDSWRVTPHLTLNYGLRYDYFDYAQPPVSNPDASLVSAPTFDTNRIHIDQHRYRASLRLCLLARRKRQHCHPRRLRHLLRRHAVYLYRHGVHPERHPGADLHVQHGAAIPVTYPNLLPGIPTTNRTPSLFVFANNFKNPRSRSNGTSTSNSQLGNNYSITLGYLGVKGSHLPRTRDINLFPALPVTAPISTGGSLHLLPSSQPAAPTRTLAASGWPTAAPIPSITPASSSSPSASRSNFQVQTSYTWSHAIDDDPDATAVVFGTDDSKIVQNNLLPNLDRGNANADIRLRFVFSGVWDLDYVPKTPTASCERSPTAGHLHPRHSAEWPSL